MLETETGLELILTTALTSAQGFNIIGAGVGDHLGWSVSFAGDVNGDGFDDVVIGAQESNLGGTDSGAVYVIFGRAAPLATLDIRGLENRPQDGFVIRGPEAGANAGYSVSSGDINGDGLSDIVIGAGTPIDSGAGNVFVVYGKTNLSGTVNLAGMATRPADGLILQGIGLRDSVGTSVGTADINNDGFDDIMVGAPLLAAGGHSYNGVGFVVFGGANLPGAITLGTFANNPQTGFFIMGDDNGDQLGTSFASAGDINGDGFEDIVIGADYAGQPDQSGEAYVIYGKAGGFGRIDLTGLASRPQEGFVIRGGASFENIGTAVAPAGDVNGDGIDDLIVSAPGNEIGGQYAGAAFIIYGKTSGFGTVDLLNLKAADGFILAGVDNTTIGRTLGRGGDLNDDGYDDLIIGAPFAAESTPAGRYLGEAYVIFGGRQLTGTIDSAGRRIVRIADLDADDGFALRGRFATAPSSRPGGSGGDFNGDGVEDVIIGSPFASPTGNYSGEAYLLYGTPNPSAPVNTAPVALDDAGTTLRGQAVTLSVLANDSDANGDVLRVSAVGTAANGIVAINLNGTVTYTPNAGFSGSDAFDYTVSDGHGGTDTGRVTVTVTLPPEPPFRLISMPGYAGGVGGNGEIFGSNGFDDIQLLQAAGRVSFDGSFARGGDIVRLPGDADDYVVSTAGSSAVLTGGGSIISIPVGTAGLPFVFEDGARTLIFDEAAGGVRIGSQIVTATAAPLTAAPDGSVLPTGANPDVAARLVVGQGGRAMLDGDANIFGTNGIERVTLFGGDAVFDGSFARGGDTVLLDDPAGAHRAWLAGSMVVVTWADGSAAIPVGTVGLTIDFDGEARMLRFDTVSGTVKIGDQSITATTADTAQILTGGAPFAAAMLVGDIFA